MCSGGWVLTNPVSKKLITNKKKSNNFNNLNQIIAFLFSGFFLALLLSVFFHIFTLWSLKKFYKGKKIIPQFKLSDKNKHVKIRIYINKKDLLKKNKPKKILETPLKKTKLPKKPDYLGVNNHQAKKIQKPKIYKKKNLTPEKMSKSLVKKEEITQIGVEKNKKIRENIFKRKFIDRKKLSNKKNFKSNNLLAYNKGIKNLPKKNAYQRLLKGSLSSINEQIALGYQDYIEDDIEASNTIDLNTQEYRYIGYFTNLRKSIELVWIYPSKAARNRIYGKVSILFIIKKSGQIRLVKILKSSGYGILDNSIVSAIKLASPFAPLPPKFPHEELKVTGNFNYILQ